MSFEIQVEKRLSDHHIAFDHRSDTKLVALFGPSGAGCGGADGPGDSISGRRKTLQSLTRDRPMSEAGAAATIPVLSRTLHAAIAPRPKGS